MIQFCRYRMSRAWGTLTVADERSNLRDASDALTSAGGREGERLDRPSKSTDRSSSCKLWSRGSSDEFFVAIYRSKERAPSHACSAMTSRQPPRLLLSPCS